MSDNKTQDTDTQKVDNATDMDVKDKTKVTDKTDDTKDSTKDGTNISVNTIDLEALKQEIADSVAKREKDKLYPTIEKYKQDLKEAQDKLKEYEDKNLSAEERMSNQLKEANEAIADLTKKMEQVAEAASKEVHAVKLEATREKMLAKYKDEIIPEMITGNTTEEIIQNAKKANELYLSIREKEEERIKRELKGKRQTTKVSSGVDPVSSSDEGLDDFEAVLENAKPEEWEALKEKLLSIAFKS